MPREPELRVTPAGDGEPVGYPEVVEAFNEICEAISSRVDLDSLLHMVAGRICALVGVRRCSVYLKDERTGLFRGKVAETDRNIDAAIKSLTAGIEADGFTREILKTKRPVLIVNAQSDPRPVRSAMLEWDVHTMLGVPMILRGEVIGLLFLDNEDIQHDYTEDEQKLCATFANLSAIAISHAQLTTKLRSSLKTLEQKNATLCKAAAIEDRLANLVLEGATLGDIAQAVSDLTRKPAVILDAELRPLALSGTRACNQQMLRSLVEALRSEPQLRGALHGLEGKRPRLLDQGVSLQLEDRLLVAPVSVGDELWGYLLVVERGAWFNARDMIVARRAGTIVALELSAERRAAEAEARATEALTRDLIHGTDEQSSLEHRAEYHGVRLSDPHAVCLFTARGNRKSPTPRRVREALTSVRPGTRPLVSGVEDGVVAVVEAPEGATGRQAKLLRKWTQRAVASLGGSGVVAAAISSVCQGARHYPAAFGEARQVARCISLYRSQTDLAVLAADDLGAARLLLAGASREQADKFVHDTLGVLLDDPSMNDLLATLQVFFAVSRSVRRSAQRLGVHENTIRYRLGRIEEATGLKVSGNADDQLTAQMALLILRLAGTLPASDSQGQEALGAAVE